VRELLTDEGVLGAFVVAARLLVVATESITRLSEGSVVATLADALVVDDVRTAKGEIVLGQGIVGV
jgi:hypothetical protein